MDWILIMVVIVCALLVSHFVTWSVRNVIREELKRLGLLYDLEEE